MVDFQRKIDELRYQKMRDTEKITKLQQMASQHKRQQKVKSIRSVAGSLTSMLGSPQHNHHSGNGGNSLIDPFGTMIGNTSSGGIGANAFGGGGRTYQAGMMTLDEPAVINNKSSFIQKLNQYPTHHFYMDSDDNSSPCQGNGSSTQILMKSMDTTHRPQGIGGFPVGSQLHHFQNKQNQLGFGPDIHQKGIYQGGQVKRGRKVGPHKATSGNVTNERFKSPESLSMEFIYGGGGSSSTVYGENNHEEFQIQQQMPSFGGALGQHTIPNNDERVINQKINSQIDYNLISSTIGSGKIMGLQDGEGLSRQVVHQHDPHSMIAYGNKPISRGQPGVPSGAIVDLGFGNDDGINHIVQGDRILTVHNLQNHRQYWRTYENSRVPSLNGRQSAGID